MSALVVTTRAGGWHSYSLRGQRLPGVTTCIGAMAKPALVGAAAKEAAIWAANNPDQLTALGHEEFVQMAKGAPQRVWGQASKIGQDLHSHAEKLATTGEAPDVPESDLAMVVQAADFLDTMQVRTIVAERAVWHDQQLYAGRLDLLAEIDGAVWLLDFKTGASGIWPEAALQQSAYRFATHMQGPEPDSPDEEMPPVAHAGCVWVRPEGWQLVPVRADRDVWQAFLATIPLYRFMQLQREEVIAAPAAAGRASHAA
jgi:hypothetical protein